MGKSGPKPKPSALRVFEGTRPRYVNKGKEPEPAQGDGVPEAPPWLEGEAVGKWAELAPLLHATRVLTNADLDRLGLYCAAFADYRTYTETLKAEGAVIVGAKGGKIQHPAALLRAKAMDQLRQYGNDLGLSPAARVGLKVDSTAGQPGGLDEFKATGS